MSGYRGKRKGGEKGGEMWSGCKKKINKLNKKKKKTQRVRESGG